MKYLVLILTLSICLAACKKTTTPINTNAHTTPPSTTSTLTITVNSATITAGQAVTLIASGANTYTWSTGATTSSITVSPTSTTSYTVTGAQGGNTGTAISVVTVSTSTIVTKDSVWFDITFIVPSSTNTAFGYRYDTSTTRILVNGHKINAGGYNRVTDVYVTNGNIIESRNYQFTSNTLTVPILMNKNDSITIEVDSVYCFFSSQTTFNFVDVLIDKNAHKPNATNITTTEKASTYNSELALATASGSSLHYVGLAPISGQQNNQQWYIGNKFSYTWVNH